VNLSVTNFESLTAGILVNTDSDREVIEEPFEIPLPVIVKNDPVFFETRRFQTELRNKSIDKNKNYQLYSENLGAYDIASGCSRSVYYRIKNIPARSYADKWLPVHLRTQLGQAVHDFIQENSSTFTEQEVCLKVPSKRMSCRLDCLINDDVLVEIKSCPYSDIAKIIKTGKPRPNDFYQASLYKYLLETYLDEIKKQKPTRGGSNPLLDSYNIKYLQFIYVCHEVICADSESMSEAVKFAQNLRKLSNSKKDPFWFIQTVNIDLKTIDMTFYENIIKEKIDEILYYLDNDKIPELDSKYIDKKACFFCIYGDVCKSQG